MPEISAVPALNPDLRFYRVQFSEPHLGPSVVTLVGVPTRGISGSAGNKGWMRTQASSGRSHRDIVQCVTETASYYSYCD